MTKPKDQSPETIPESAPESASESTNGAGEEPTVEEAPEVAAEESEVETEAPETEEVEEERDLEAEIAELNDKLLRSLAEIENLRRRGRKEREDTAKYAVAGFARDLLSVADNLGRALTALPEGEEPDENGLAGFIEGVKLTERELAGVFERHGIEKIEPLGEKFDPNLHEAMFEIPSDAAPGTVVQIVEVGYVLKERLLLAAKVGIARALPDAEKGEHVDTTA